MLNTIPDIYLIHHVFSKPNRANDWIDQHQYV